MTRATHAPEVPFANHQRNNQRSNLVVVISGDGELITSVPSSVAGEILSVRTAINWMCGILMCLYYISCAFVLKLACSRCKWLNFLHYIWTIFFSYQWSGKCKGVKYRMVSVCYRLKMGYCWSMLRDLLVNKFNLELVSITLTSFWCE